MIYQRGSRGSYDLWAQEVGDESYSWNNMLPFFEKSVHVSPPKNDLRVLNASVDFSTTAYNRTGGPLKVSWPNYAMPFGSYGLPAMRQAGLKALPDFSGGDLHGSAYSVSNTEVLPAGWRRWSNETLNSHLRLIRSTKLAPRPRLAFYNLRSRWDSH